MENVSGFIKVILIRTTQVGSDPESQIKMFIEDGAEIIHIVDLDGARSGNPDQIELISKLCGLSTVPVQVGGGIRSLETVKAYIRGRGSKGCPWNSCIGR